MMRSLLTISVLACAIAATSLAHAQEDAEAHVRNGIELRRRGRDQLALDEFQKAYALARTGRTAAQLGLCEQALGHWIDADEHLAEALDHGDDPWVAKNRAVLQSSASAAKEHIGTLEIIGDPPGAEVLFSGRAVGRLPMPRPAPVNEGTVDVEVRAPGHRTGTRSVTIRPGQYERLVIRLERDSVAGPPSASQPAPDLTLAAAQEPALGSEQPDKSWTSRPWVWVVAGVVVIAAITGTLLATKQTTYPSADQTLDLKPR